MLVTSNATTIRSACNTPPVQFRELKFQNLNAITAQSKVTISVNIHLVELNSRQRSCHAPLLLKFSITFILYPFAPISMLLGVYRMNSNFLPIFCNIMWVKGETSNQLIRNKRKVRPPRYHDCIFQSKVGTFLPSLSL